MYPGAPNKLKTRVVLLVLLLLTGCGTCGGEPVEDDDLGESARPELFFPMHLGDRWGYAEGGGVAVTAVTDSGVAVFFGSDRTSAERYKTNDAGEVLLVDPTDRAIATWLAVPMELGHAWQYTVGDTSCEARYATVDQDASLPGMEIHGCVEVRRRCQLPEGKPFPDATMELHEEVYCPYVGRVHETIRFEPRPQIEDFPETKEFQVAFYRIEGAVAVPEPETFGCPHFLLMDTDIQAACGPMIRRETQHSDANECSTTFVSGNGNLTVFVKRLTGEATVADVDAHLPAGDPESARVNDGWHIRDEAGAVGTFETPDGELERRAQPSRQTLGTREGRFVIRLAVDEGVCAAAATLQPTLRSLVR